MSRLLNVDSVCKYFSSEPILDHVSFEIRCGQHIALIGPNGAGKTTLLKILMKQLEPDRGQIQYSKLVTLGILSQRPAISDTATIWDTAQEGLRPILEMVKQSHVMAEEIAVCRDETSRKLLVEKYDQLQVEISHRDGFQLERKTERVLDGLGFAKSDFDKPVAQLSGGQVSRVMLAKLLLEEPNLMLLDEPSNHLDINATEWLEDFLNRSQQAFLLVSHDRYFLDRVSDITLELVNSKIDKYPGNYTKYRELKQQRLEVQRRTFEKQQIEIEKLKDFIRRNHYGQKHLQAEDRRKKLERIVPVEVPREISVPPMKFAQASRSGDVVLSIDRLSKSFGEQILFDDLTFQIQRGERWGIIGPNGCGKTTLLNCVLQQLPP
jgi:ATP-binding cassette subfamily F protein 3